MVGNLVHDTKDELLIWFLDLDFIKSILENADSQIFVHPNNNKNSVIFGGRQKKRF